MMKTIAYISGTRADFGLMSSVLEQIQEYYSLDVYATGMHLMPEFGGTIDEVRRIFPKARALNAHWTSDNRGSVIVFTSALLREIGLAFQKRRPDLVITLGDRSEMLCTAMACLYLGIPSAHFHGGDKTKTADETARHAITKLSHLHFTATKESAKRIIAMGEEKWRVHVVGAPSLDYITQNTLPNRKAVSSFLTIGERDKYLLVLQHPVSEEIGDAASQMNETLRAVAIFHLPAVVVYPNSDAGGRAMIRVLEREKTNAQFHLFKSVSYDMFLGLQKYCEVFIGNSSSGMIESSSFHIPVVNIGIRQTGRQHGKNVISVDHEKQQIVNAVRYSLENATYRKRLKLIKNPWGDGLAGNRVLSVLQKIPPEQRLLSKQITY